MNPALADLESPIAEAVSAVALAALVAEQAPSDRQGLVAYAIFEADRKLSELQAIFDRLTQSRPMAANDNAADQAA